MVLKTGSFGLYTIIIYRLPCGFQLSFETKIMFLSIILPGKQVIHPSQIPVVQQAFSPSPDKVEWARELIKAFDEQQQSGKVRSKFKS